MADEMNGERDMPEGITRDDTVHGETYYTAADMATASAQGFRDGAASLSANAGGEPVAEVVPCHTPSGKRVALRSEAQGLPIGTKLYTHPSPPEGMVMVPKVPTNAMTSAGANAVEDPENERSSWDLAENVWRAMVEAAPALKQGAAIAAGAFCNKKQFDAQGFYQAIERDVSARKITWRELSIATGVSQTTLTRMGQGRKPDAASMAALSAWAGINPANYFKGASPQPDIAAGAVYAELDDDQIMNLAGSSDTALSDFRPLGQQWEGICNLVRSAIRASHGQAPAGATDPWQQHMAHQAEVIDAGALQHAMTKHGISTPEGGMEHFRASLGEMVNRFVRFVVPTAQQVEGGDAVGWFTVVYRGIRLGDEAKALGDHPKACILSWSNAVHDRDAARAAQKDGEKP